MEGEWVDPSGADGLNVTDQERMDEEFNNMNITDQQDYDDQPYDEAIPDENNAYLDSNAMLEPTSEDVNNMHAGLLEATTAENEEGDGILTADVVRGWNSRQTADHLRQIGIDPKHCDVFEEQEVSGDVLLEMDQDSILSQHFDFGVMGKRLKTLSKLRQFQQDLEAGAIRTQPDIPIKKSVEETDTASKDPLQSRSFRHPYTWRHAMADKLRIQETSDVRPVELLEDLEPKWVDQHPTFLDTMAAVDRSRDDVGDILSSHEQAKFRLRLSKDDPGGVERATSSMCADWLDKFNEHRKLNMYRKR